MAEELPEITDEKIEKAALPEGKRANEEVSEESTFIELFLHIFPRSFRIKSTIIRFSALSLLLFFNLFNN